MFRLTSALAIAAFSLNVLAEAKKTVKIINKEYEAPAMLFGLGEPVTVDYNHENAESVAYWDAEPVDGGYKLKNTFAESWVALTGERDILAGLLEDDADTFFFQPAEDGAFLIKFPDEDFVWDFDPTDKACLEGAVRMAPQNGKESQRWYIQQVVS
ncbi:hypothetical protein BDZ89DRAFT_1115514 [Hymenopellis radicata]|nr:hypothetical protein BDZ89DRAFT_1115514 [Hymenopellis radicata]